jgi:hypothetical protein
LLFFLPGLCKGHLFILVASAKGRQNFRRAFRLTRAAPEGRGFIPSVKQTLFRSSTACAASLAQAFASLFRYRQNYRDENTGHTTFALKTYRRLAGRESAKSSPVVQSGFQSSYELLRAGRGQRLCIAAASEKKRRKHSVWIRNLTFIYHVSRLPEVAKPELAAIGDGLAFDVAIV